MGRREVGIFRRQLPGDAQVRGLVRIARQQAVELQEAPLGIDAFGGKQLLEIRLRFVDALGGDQERRDDLQGGGRLRFDLLPGLRRLERELGQLALVGDFDGTTGDARITSAAGKLEVGLRGERVIASLLRDLAEEQLIERRLVQVLRILGLGERCCRQRERGGDHGYRGDKTAHQHLASTDVRYIWCPAQATAACPNFRKSKSPAAASCRTSPAA